MFCTKSNNKCKRKLVNLRWQAFHFYMWNTRNVVKHADNQLFCFLVNEDCN